MKKTESNYKRPVKIVAAVMVVAILATSYAFTVIGSGTSFDYIENVKTAKINSASPYSILEIAPTVDSSSMTYYADGLPENWSDVLESCVDAAQRQKYVTDYAYALQEANLLSEGSGTPLTGKAANYTESYPWSTEIGKNRINMNHTETVSDVHGTITQSINGNYRSDYTYNYVGAGGSYDLNADSYQYENVITQYIYEDSKSYSAGDRAHWAYVGSGVYRRAWLGFTVTYNAFESTFTYNGTIDTTQYTKDDNNERLLQFTVKNPEGKTYRLCTETLSGSSTNNIQADVYMDNIGEGMWRNKYDSGDTVLIGETNNTAFLVKIGYYHNSAAESHFDNFKFKVKVEEAETDNILGYRIDWDSELWTEDNPTAHWHNNLDGTYTAHADGYTAVYNYNTGALTVTGNATKKGGSSFFPNMSFHTAYDNSKPEQSYSLDAKTIGGSYDNQQAFLLSRYVPDVTQPDKTNYYTPDKNIDNSTSIEQCFTKYSHSLYQYKEIGGRKRTYINLAMGVYQGIGCTTANIMNNYQISVQVYKDIDEVLNHVIADGKLYNADAPQQHWKAYDRFRRVYTLSQKAADGNTRMDFYYDVFNRQVCVNGTITEDHANAETRLFSFLVNNTAGEQYIYNCAHVSGTNSGSTTAVSRLFTGSASVKSGNESDSWNGKAGGASGTNLMPDSSDRDIGGSYKKTLKLTDKKIALYSFLWTSTSKNTITYTNKIYTVSLRKNPCAADYNNLVEKAVKTDISWKRDIYGIYSKTEKGITLRFNPVTDTFTLNGTETVNYGTGEDDTDSSYKYLEVLDELFSFNVAAGDYLLQMVPVSGKYSSSAELCSTMPDYYEMTPTCYLTAAGGGSLDIVTDNGSASSGAYFDLNAKKMGADGRVSYVSFTQTAKLAVNSYYFIPDVSSAKPTYDNYTVKLNLTKVNADSDHQYYAALTFDALKTYNEDGTFFIPDDGTMVFENVCGNYQYVGTVGTEEIALNPDAQYYVIKEVIAVSPERTQFTPYHILVSKTGDERYVAKATNTPGAFDQVEGSNDLTYLGDGTGNCDFTYTGKATDPAYNINTNTVFCNDFCTSNQWFKRCVLECDSTQMEQLRVMVTTVTPEMLNQNPDIVYGADMIVFTAGLSFIKNNTPYHGEVRSVTGDFSDETYHSILTAASNSYVAVVVDNALNDKVTGNYAKVINQLGNNLFDYQSFIGQCTGASGTGGSVEKNPAFRSFVLMGSAEGCRPQTQDTQNYRLPLAVGHTYRFRVKVDNLSETVNNNVKACVRQYDVDNVNLTNTSYPKITVMAGESKSWEFEYTLIEKDGDTTLSGDVGMFFYVDSKEKNDSGDTDPAHNYTDCKIQFSEISVVDITDGTTALSNGTVTNNIYVFNAADTLGCTSLATNLFNNQTIQDAYMADYAEVTTDITNENNLRIARGSSNLVSTDLTVASCMRCIINHPGKRVVNKKKSINVLELEPYSNTPKLTKATVKSWFNENTFSDSQITIQTMAMGELVGDMDDLVEQYDVVFVGASTENMNTSVQNVQGNNVTLPNYNDDNMDGLFYSNIGDLFYGVSGFWRSGTRSEGVLGGLVADDYNVKSRTDNAIQIDASDDTYPSDTNEVDLRSSGNDLTTEKYDQLKTAAEKGLPIIFADDLALQDASTTISVRITATNKNWYTGHAKLTANVISTNELQGIQYLYSWYWCAFKDDYSPDYSTSRLITSGFDKQSIEYDFKSANFGNYAGYGIYYCDVKLVATTVRYNNIANANTTVRSDSFCIAVSPTYVDENVTLNNACLVGAFARLTLDEGNRKYRFLSTMKVYNDVLNDGTYMDIPYGSVYNNPNSAYNGFKWTVTYLIKWKYGSISTMPNDGRLENVAPNVAGTSCFDNKFQTKSDNYRYKYFEFKDCRATIKFIPYAGADEQSIDISTFNYYSISGFRFFEDWDLYNNRTNYQPTSITSNRIVDSDRVDNSSMLYRFMSETLGTYNNVMTEYEAAQAAGQKLLSEYVNLSVPTINIVEGSYKAYDEEAEPEDITLQDNTLSVEFTITNPTDLTPATSMYQAVLSLDKNADGNFTDDEVLSNPEFVRVTSATDREVKNGQLRQTLDNSASKDTEKKFQYRISQKLPDDVVGCVPWELKVIKVGDSHAKATFRGYSYVMSTTPKVINVVQILPNKYKMKYEFAGGVSALWPTGYKDPVCMDSINILRSSRYSSSGETRNGSVFFGSAYDNGKIPGVTRIDSSTNSSLKDNQVMIKVKNDFILNITVLNLYCLEAMNDGKTSVVVTNAQAMGEGEYEDDYQEDYGGSTISYTVDLNKPILDYDMLIVGFGDAYFNNIEEKTAKTIADFIESGNPVLYSHDTTSYYNSYVDKSDDLSIYNAYINGFYMNKYVRPLTGQDRYGAAYVVKSLFDNGDGTVDGYSGTSGGSFTKKYSGIYYDNATRTIRAHYYKNRDLIADGSVGWGRAWKDYSLNNNGYDFSASGMEDAGYTVAYQIGSNRTETTLYPQGFTRQTMVRFNMPVVRGISDADKFASKLSPTKRLSSQFKTGYDSSGNKKYNKAGGNGFKGGESDGFSANGQNYIGNCTPLYTTKVSQLNQGQITTFPFNLNLDLYNNEEIEVAQTHEPYYQLNVDDPLVHVWFCLAGDGYANDVYNDASNSYFIYSRDNLIYTGAGHTNQFTDFEAKLFLNAMIAAYNILPDAPVVAFTNESGDTNLSYLMVTDDKLDAANELSTYVKVTNPNTTEVFGTDGKASLTFTYQRGDNSITFVPKLYDPETGNEVAPTAASLNKRYRMVIPNELKQLLSDEELSELVISVKGVATTTKNKTLTSEISKLTLRVLGYQELS